MQPYPPPARNLLRLSLIAGTIFLFAGCAFITPQGQRTRRMNRSLGKPFSEVVREHGQRPVYGPEKVGNNRYAYTYRYYRTRYAGNENLGTYNYTTYFAHVCYAHYLTQIYYTDANDIVVDWKWHLSPEWRIDCNER